MRNCEKSAKLKIVIVLFLGNRKCELNSGDCRKFVVCMKDMREAKQDKMTTSGLILTR